MQGDTKGGEMNCRKCGKHLKQELHFVGYSRKDGLQLFTRTNRCPDYKYFLGFNNGHDCFNDGENGDDDLATKVEWETR